MSQTETTILGENLEDVVETKTGDVADLSRQADADTPLAELVGEGKKYKTAEDLAKAYLNADQFIETLKGEKRSVEEQVASLQEQTTKSKTIDDVLAALRESPTDHTDDTTDDQSGSSHSAEDITVAVQRILDAKDLETATKKKQDVIKANQAKAWEMLSDPEVFGDIATAKAKVAEFIKANPSRANVVNEAGSHDPESLVRLLKPEAKIPSVAAKENALNIGEQPRHSGGVISGWSEAQRVRKSDPKTYNSLAYQNKLHLASEADPNFMKK